MRTTAAISRHMLLALAEGFLLAVFIGGIFVAVSVARPGSNVLGVGNAGAAPRTVTSSIWLEQPSGAALTASWPTLGSSVAFGTTYPKATKNPWVSLLCYQGDTLVYGEGGTADHVFVLGGASSVWLNVGGSADCTAELGDLYWRGGHEYYTYLADTSFQAN